MKVIKRCTDITYDEIKLFEHNGYVSIDTETTGLDYVRDNLCTIQIFSEDYALVIKFDSKIEYNNLKEVLYSKSIVKIFHNAPFDVSFLMRNLKMETFGNLVCTKIASKIIHGLEHNNSLQSLLKEYLGVIISKEERLSDWSKEELSKSQIGYAINDVRYLYKLWKELSKILSSNNLEDIAIKSFEFVPTYVKLLNKGIDNIFTY